MKSQKVRTWLKQNFTSANTRCVYYRAITEFLELYGEPTTPEELENALKQWIHAQAMRSPKTINTYVAAVLSYFKDQNIIPEYRWGAVRRRLLPPAKEATIDKAGTHEEWKRILYHMDVRGRSLYLFLLSTGARIGETLKLKITDLELDADPPMAHIRQSTPKVDTVGERSL